MSPLLAEIAIALLAAVAVVLLWMLLARARTIEARLRELERLEPIQSGLTKLGQAREGLDLRRLEHVLIDMRDGQKRLEQRLMQLAESGAPEAERKAVAPIAERIVNRLLAMGCERIQIVTPGDELPDPGCGSGEVLVEARRAGAGCKGRVIVRDGTIAAIDLKSTHSMFP